MDIAELLFSLGAVELRTEAPYFTFASGIQSPVYTDNRLLLADPQARRAICQAFRERLLQLRITPTAVAGTATAGIPHAAYLAEALELPLVYVRTQAKEHGKGQRIEGRLAAGAQVVLIEDLISTGGSAVSAAEALREAGCTVCQVLAIFNYGFPVAREAFARAGLGVSTLLHFEELLDRAVRTDRLSQVQAAGLRRFSANPEGWLGSTQAVMSKPAAKAGPVAALAVAADLSVRTELETLVKAVSGIARYIKLNAAFVEHGPALVKWVQRQGLGVFLDLKFHDIPNTAANHVRTAAELGVELLTVHAGGGSAMLRACVEAARSYGSKRPRILAVTALTSLDDTALAELGMTGGRDVQVRRLAQLAHHSGVDGIVCSVGESAAVRAACGEEFLIVTPGVRPQGATPDDHARSDTPAAAIAAGAQVIVIGRPIYRAADPRAAARAVAAELQMAMEAHSYSDSGSEAR